MKSASLYLALLLTVFAITPAVHAQEPRKGAPSTPAPASRSEPGYLIQPGDILTVSVWKEKDLQSDELVRPDGALSFPLTGDIQAAGKTVEQVREEIATRLGKYIPDPVVTVTMKQIAGNVIYVIGKVNKPGVFVANGNVDVMQALSIAGGMTPYASENSIRILRRQGSTESAIPFKYAQVRDGKHLEQNIILQAGDVVVVP
ncbi:MAG: polysaccharide biosynthesis/export family protein [Acidiferrobacterales bacterium]